jgi:hypothetical protein
MPRERIFSSSADRQKAYRERIKKGKPIPAVRISSLSRPKRLKKLFTEAESLLSDYQSWLENLPENLQNSAQAERLQETIDALEQICDILGDIEAPKGFGRD